MRFSKEKREELKGKLFDIFLACLTEAMEKQDLKYTEEWYFMEKVFHANLVTEPKQYFLLGALAKEISDFAPEAIAETMTQTLAEAMRLIRLQRKKGELPN